MANYPSQKVLYIHSFNTQFDHYVVESLKRISNTYERVNYQPEKYIASDD